MAIDPKMIGDLLFFLGHQSRSDLGMAVAELINERCDFRAEAERLRSAIRRHRDERGDDRCWLDDMRLYNALGEGPADCTLPPKCEFLESCERYWERRQSPEAKGVHHGD